VVAFPNSVLRRCVGRDLRQMLQFSLHTARGGPGVALWFGRRGRVYARGWHGAAGTQKAPQAATGRCA